MGQFGEKLRRERELRAITLEEIALATKIGSRSLRALEEEKFDQLPGGIFNKGFVRAYAHYVGIDEEQAVADYIAAVRAGGESAEPNIALIAAQVKSSREREGSHSGAPAIIWVLVIILAGTSAGLGGWPYLKAWVQRRAEARQRVSQAPPAVPSSVAPQEQATPAVAPQPTPAVATPTADSANTGTAANQPGISNQSSSANPPPATVPEAARQLSSGKPPNSAAAKLGPQSAQQPEAGSVSLVVKAKQRAWISVHADGKLVGEETLDPESGKSERSFRAQDELVLVVGNPAGIDVTFNGQPLGSLGPVGQRRSFTFTAAGLQQQ